MTWPPPDDAVLPPPGRPARGRWAGRVIVWLGLALGFILLTRFDVTLMRWRFTAFPEGFSGGTQQLIFGLRDFGQLVPMIAAGAIALLADRRWKSFVVALLLGQVLVLLGCHSAKWCLQRYRPYPAMAEVTGPHTETQQAQHEADTLARMAPGDTWVRRSDVHWPPPSGQDSFPSGHSGAAFAFAAVLARFYPRLRWVFWVLAAGCAVSRSLDAVHWPSDCLAGATIGYAAGWLVLHFTQGRFAPPESAGASFDATARA